MLRYLLHRLVGVRASRRHLKAFMQYSTPAKVANLMLCEAEKHLCIAAPKSMPYSCEIDAANVCNLRCSYCPTGLGKEGRTKSLISLEQVERILDELGRFLYIVHLFNWGEALLNPRLGQIVRLVHSKKIYTSISSNFNIRKKELFEELCESGLDHLIASVDGGSQGVYSQYRQGGDLELVLENLHHVMAYKKRKNLRTPIVQWRFLIFPHNAHEVETARLLAEKIGVDAFIAEPGIVPQALWEKSQSGGGDAVQCAKLWYSMTFQADGGISPCCNLFDARDDFGALSGATIRQTWHNTRFQMARKMFDPRRVGELPPDLSHPCLHCPFVLWQPHLRAYLEENPFVRLGDPGRKIQDDVFAIRSSSEDAGEPSQCC